MADAQPMYEFKELEKFQMFTNAPGVEGKRSRLVWSSYRGNPRITVFTQVPNDANKGIMNAAMNPETFLMFMDLLEKVAREPAESKYKLACYTLIKNSEDAKRSERVLTSDLYFGRDASGLVWISVVVENRPKIKFDFKISDFHKLYKGDGSQFTEAESSSLQALATIRALREVMMIHMGELRPRLDSGAGKGTAGNRFQGGSNGGAPRPAPSMEQFEDISL